MKKSLLVQAVCLILGLSILLSACGSKEPVGKTPSARETTEVTQQQTNRRNDSGRSPSDALLEEDLQEGLQVYVNEWLQALNGLPEEVHCYAGETIFTLRNFDIEQSLTEEKSYSATIYVEAENEYAIFHNIVASVNYTRFDQGWSLDNLEWDWSAMEYETTEYPTSDLIQTLVAEGGEGLAIPTGGRRYIEMKKNDDYTVTIQSVLDELFDDENYISQSVSISSTWYYNAEMLSWMVDLPSREEYYSTPQLSSNLEGTWEIENYTITERNNFHHATVTISNINENGFDVSFPDFSFLSDFGSLNVHVVYDSSENKFIETYSDQTGRDTPIKVWFTYGRTGGDYLSATIQVNNSQYYAVISN